MHLRWYAGNLPCMHDLFQQRVLSSVDWQGASFLHPPAFWVSTWNLQSWWWSITLEKVNELHSGDHRLEPKMWTRSKLLCCISNGNGNRHCGDGLILLTNSEAHEEFWITENGVIVSHTPEIRVVNDHIYCVHKELVYESSLWARYCTWGAYYVWL